nr:hypothetical protein B0A51_01450 [Rachicladosporium sp. CCFEE 5018]
MNSMALHSPPTPKTVKLPAMISEVHLDLTGIGDRIASELRDAPNDMRLDSSNMLTADDIGRSVGKAIKKRLSETKAQDGESQKSIGQLSATSLVQTQILSKLVDAIHKKEDMALAAEDTDEESTVSEANDDTGLDAASLREMTMSKLIVVVLHINHSQRKPSKMRIAIFEVEGGLHASVVYTENKIDHRACVGGRAIQPCSLDGYHSHTYKIAVNVAYLEGAVSSSDFAALLSLYAHSKERLGAVSIGESYVTTD